MDMFKDSAAVVGLKIMVITQPFFLLNQNMSF